MEILNKLIEKENLKKYITIRTDFLKSCIYNQSGDDNEFEIRLSELKNLKEWLKIQ